MYDYIKGEIVSKNLTTPTPTITIENNGIGYIAITNFRTISTLEKNNKNEQSKIYLTLIHKEDTMTLCGFATKEERDIFNILQSVSGVGMKVALVLLNEFSTYELITAVIKEDCALISKAKGIGPKLAKKIILELKDKLMNYSQTTPIQIKTNAQTEIADDVIEEVQSVLYSFGYTQEEIKSSIEHSLEVSEKTQAEEILKNALKFLSQN